MKKVFALLLCLLMLTSLAVGCGNEQKPEELNDTRAAADLTGSTHLYFYNHVVGTPDVSALTVTQRTEDGDFVTLSVDADLAFPNANVALLAEMKYQLVDNQWKLENITITEKSIEVTGAPHQHSVVSELTNYIGIVGSAYSVLNDTYQPLVFNITDATITMEYEAGAKTAALKLVYTSDKLTFEGTYTLTFSEETGWSLETVKQEDGRQHPLLRLTKLEKK